MRKSIVCLCQCMVLLVFLALALNPVCQAEGISVGASVQQEDLKKQCLAATIAAINLEIGRHQRWLDFRQQQGNQQGLAELQASLASLRADLAKYLALEAKDYVLPEKVDAVAWAGDKPGRDAVLYVAGMSKNGPWYHLAGIAGGDYSVLQPNARHRVSFYNVYPRSYWGMDSAYIYVAAIDSPGKRISGEAFVYKYNGLKNDLAKCDNYQVYLLKDLNPGSPGELVLDSKASAFDFTLSAEQLAENTYLEFVYNHGSKTIRLDQITDKPLKIVLEAEVIVKKPAIYLYPERKTQITVTHDFKGRLLSTYPAYDGNWTVIANPDGTLLNLKDNRRYQYLFWDGVYTFPPGHYQYKSGFYVKRGDYVSFLQSKLATIGLNENEINDFIVFWLPLMNNHQNCFVHFRINDNIGGSSVLKTTPRAETTIRVFMEFAGVADINTVAPMPEQVLPTFARKGFTLVEWGGAEIGDGKIQ